MKRFLYFILVVLIGVFITACANESDNSKEESKASSDSIETTKFPEKVELV
ncbi:hypothetical protein [Sporosarcina sp. P13]|uniref:hypothetical protein n=1 Tax=Sporosarcina sp. P13 TaxID=2048263 RepID=UPI00130408A8|nr:hypothetical protein [Sporosarcina sp. P13]